MNGTLHCILRSDKVPRVHVGSVGLARSSNATVRISYPQTASLTGMDYLRSAASAVLSKSAGPLPGFTIGAAHAPSHSSSPTIWSMHDGVRREDNSPCTIFTFEGAGNTTHLTLARNALRKLRTLRHPDVLKLIDSNETPSGVYIAVERVRRLPDVLKEWDGSKESKRETCVWGLSKVAVSQRSGEQAGDATKKAHKPSAHVTHRTR